EHVLLYVYCWDHAVAQCAGCAQSFRQEEFGANPFDSRAYGCRHCGADLTESIRAHLTACAMLPEQLRQRGTEDRGVTLRLVERGYQLCDRTDVRILEVEAALDALNETRER